MPLVNPLVSSKNPRQAERKPLYREANESTVHIRRSDESLSLVESSYLSGKSIDNNPVISKRVQALDSFRGLANKVMIFVNYDGGGYWFFHHA
ncbi:unnamed protein product, partial [Didymodactylos carnosus]